MKVLIQSDQGEVLSRFIILEHSDEERASSDEAIAEDIRDLLEGYFRVLEWDEEEEEE